MNPLAFGRQLKNKRKNILRKSQTEIGGPFGLSKHYLSLIERGKIDKPDIDTLINIANAYEVDLKDAAEAFFKDAKKAGEYITVHSILRQLEADEKLKLGSLVREAIEEKMGERTKLLIVRLYEKIYKKKLL